MNQAAAAIDRKTDLLPPDLLAQIGRLELVSRRVLRGRLRGERRSRRRGQSVEFADYRSYVPGDDLRFIDWNLYARFDRLFLKLFQAEEDLHFFALVDASPSMGFGDPTKFFCGLQLAAALGYVGLCRQDRVRIEPLGLPQAAAAPTLRGRHSLGRMLGYLRSLECNGTGTLEASVKSFCLRNPGQGIVVLITDLMDKQGYESALRYLVARNLDIYVLHLLSLAEIEPDLAGDLKLVDSEDADIAEVSVSQRLLDRYRRTLAAFLQQARDFCARRSITYMMTTTDRPVDRLITRYLRERGLVR